MDKYLIALTHLPGLGPITILKILKYLTPEQIWRADFSDLKNIGLSDKAAQLIIGEKIKINPDQIIEQIDKEKIKTLTIYDEDYPKLLKELANPPIVLYYKGDSKILSDPLCFSIVGTRKITSYGYSVLENIIPTLIRNNFVIISGLALGTDSLAHQLTLKNNGKTAAVLGCGLDQIYPQSNNNLARGILEKGGLIMTEFPIGTPPFKQNFPYRNRIISGLSRATLITEADIKSGAMITAKYALEQNREVLALPGNILHRQSTGPNKLIQSGAKIITEVSDILETYGLTPNNDSYNNNESPRLITFNSPEEKIIYDLIKSGVNTLDQLKINSHLPVALINANLTMLEIKGIIKNINGEFIIL